ncbi:alpha/beta fold hydrolase [Nocardia sp. NBC_00508]|uniref:alpha/beta fold hydrolase n=1 Tax=Nocardia sp. NBC_00508 TaxID=2975992 RepID=UPI003FA5FCDC
MRGRLGESARTGQLEPLCPPARRHQADREVPISIRLCERTPLVSTAGAGYHVVAPDLRAFGRTTGWEGRYDADIAQFRNLNLVTDMVALLRALEIEWDAGVVGHDLGSAVAGYCAMVRPDVFRSVVMMSAPFAGVSALPWGQRTSPPAEDLSAALGSLTPPRKHYQPTSRHPKQTMTCQLHRRACTSS